MPGSNPFSVGPNPYSPPGHVGGQVNLPNGVSVGGHVNPRNPRDAGAHVVYTIRF